MQWVAQNAQALGIDPRRIAVAGDSAGGNLSTVAALLAKRAGGPPLAFQLLLYPAVSGDAASHPSLTEYAEGYFLTKADMECVPSPLPAASVCCVPAHLCACSCVCVRTLLLDLALRHTALCRVSARHRRGCKLRSSGCAWPGGGATSVLLRAVGRLQLQARVRACQAS